VTLRQYVHFLQNMGLGLNNAGSAGGQVSSVLHHREWPDGNKWAFGGEGGQSLPCRKISHGALSRGQQVLHAETAGNRLRAT